MLCYIEESLSYSISSFLPPSPEILKGTYFNEGKIGSKNS
jgi:hypothetical protein